MKFSVPVPTQYAFETAQKLFRVDMVSSIFEAAPTRRRTPSTVAYPAVAPGQLLVTALDLTKRVPPPGVSFIPHLDVRAIKEDYRMPQWQIESDTTIQISAQDLIAADSGGTSDPYFIWKNSAGTVILKSKYIKKTLNPVWKPYEVLPGSAAGGGLIQLFDHDPLKDDPLGTAPFPFTITDYNNLAPGGRMEKVVPIQHPKRGSSSAGTVKVVVSKTVKYRRLMAAGVLPMITHPIVTNSDPSYPKILPTSTFLQALGCGMKMMPWMVLDMTSSNGAMHNIGEHPNPYETCISAVGQQVLKSYTPDNICTDMVVLTTTTSHPSLRWVKQMERAKKVSRVF
ncbi:hypothetical protein Pelo_10756 [Pelomyxa schiedti]|nr:hypothetical protein Pelo_10756 [Pelomyxa schiedti]